MPDYAYTVEIIQENGGLTDLAPTVETVEVDIAGPQGAEGPQGPQGNTNVVILGPTDVLDPATPANTAVFRYR